MRRRMVTNIAGYHGIARDSPDPTRQFPAPTRTNPPLPLQSSLNPSSPSLPEASKFSSIRDSLRDLYLSDPRPWLIGFSGGKDSTLVAALIFETVLALPPEQRTKETSVVCTDTRVAIPASEKPVWMLDQTRPVAESE